MNRSDFANGINLDLMWSSANLSANECESFGMTWGCKPDCPAFQNGKCKDVAYTNFQEFIKDGELDFDEVVDLIEKYRFTLEEKSELLWILNNKQI